MALNFQTFFPDIDMRIVGYHGITFGIKIQIDNQAPFISTFRAEGMELDSTLATCLSPIFISQTIATYGLSTFNPDLSIQVGHIISGNAPDNNISYGCVETLETDNSYGLDITQAPVVLVSHVPSLIRQEINNGIMPPPEYENNYAGWITHLESLSDSERAELYLTEARKKIINEKHTITFLRQSAEDKYGDLFDVLFKSPKVNKPIPQFDLTPASVQQDKIVFTSLCQVQNLSTSRF